MPFANSDFFDQASSRQPVLLAFPCLRYVVRLGWLEAFEWSVSSSLQDSLLPRFVPWVQAARGLRKDAVSLAKGSFGVFELFLSNEKSIRIADASTRWAHLSSKVQLAQYATLVNRDICPESGWLRWDCEFDGSAKDPFANPRPGGEFLFQVAASNPWVLKRDGASGGKGIVFVTDVQQIKGAVDEARDIEEALPFVDDRREQIAGWAAQRHINPMLIMNGRKFHLRVYVVSIGDRNFWYDEDFEVRVAPEPWQPDFNAEGCHITNGGGAEAKHERRYLGSEVAELSSVRDKVPLFISQVCSHPAAVEGMELDETWIPASVLGLDIMIDENGKLKLLESNHSPASPPYDDESTFSRHVRRLVHRIVSMLVSVGLEPDMDSKKIRLEYGFKEIGLNS